MNQKLNSRAKFLRKNQTDAESRLWFYLRSRQLCRYKFRRQYVMESYIVDFICLSKKVIVELDGSQHAAAKKYDDKRTKFLESRGFRVLRFWNNVVMTDVEMVLENILLVLEGKV